MSGATGEKPTWPPSSPPYHAVMALMPRFGMPAWTCSCASSVGHASGPCFVPQTAPPGIAVSNASLIFAKR